MLFQRLLEEWHEPNGYTVPLHYSSPSPKYYVSHDLGPT